MTSTLFPKAIEIQTTNFCNANCIICPYCSIKNKKGFMEDELFLKIIEEAEKYQENLRLIPYLNGEPLFDEKIIDRIKHINKSCPKAIVELSTNMSMFNTDIQNKFKEIRIDDFRMSIFGFTENTYEKMMPGLNWNTTKDNLDRFLDDDILRSNIKEISIVMIEHFYVPIEEYQMVEEYCKLKKINFLKWGFLDRASNVKGMKNDFTMVTKGLGCSQKRDLERMHVTYDGKVIQCCQDWRMSNILGDLSEQSIYDIWNSPKYKEHRSLVNDPSKESPDLCQKCKLMVRKYDNIH